MPWDPISCMAGCEIGRLASRDYCGNKKFSSADAIGVDTSLMFEQIERHLPAGSRDRSGIFGRVWPPSLDANRAPGDDYGITRSAHR
jgi:hypothetical protein